MKRLLHLILFLSIFSGAFAQLDERVFFQVGGTLGADIRSTSGSLDGRNDFTAFHYNYASVIFTGRINVIEFSNNSAISLGLQPTFGIGATKGGNGSMTGHSTFRLPMVFELNFNAGSTVSTRKDVGFSIGGGAQYVRYPTSGTKSLAVANAPSRTSDDFLGVNATWLEPVMVVGLKFFGKHYYCREVNLRMSYANKSKDVENGTVIAPNSVITGMQTMAFTLSFLQYINY